MNRHHIALIVIGMSIFAICGQWPRQAAAGVNVDVGGVRIQVGNNPPPPPVMTVEVLTRGPIHEAFAQPVTFEDAVFIIRQRPPAPLDEIVPDERPYGNNIVWIPGYWSRDTDRGEFIWISGCWRAVPPNTSWVPGYWAAVDGGYQWVAGFWTSANTDEIEYLPAPPATLEEGPGGTLSSPELIWIPGCWVRYQGRYAWRSGSWQSARPDWVWEPAHYVYSPRGCIYVDGYWDYPLDRRGVAFLPVYCPSSLYSRPGFRYHPQMVIDLDIITLSLFSSPQRHHYYFGDYYAPEYSRQGFHPWYESRDRHDWYDPIYVHEQWRHRNDRRWADNQRSEYEHRRDNKSLRPAKTYERMRTQADRLPEKDRRNARMARPINEVVSEKNATPFKYSKQDAKSREAEAGRAKNVHDYTNKRERWESPAVAPKKRPEPKSVVQSRESAPTAPKESPKRPVKEDAPQEKPQKSDRRDVVKGQPAGQDVQPQRVKIPKSPVSVRDKERAPAGPKQPDPDPNAMQRNSKDKGRSDKDKNNSKRK